MFEDKNTVADVKFFPKSDGSIARISDWRLHLFLIQKYISTRLQRQSDTLFYESGTGKINPRI